MTKDLIREFETGANRDLDLDKLDYEGFYSPIVLEAFAKYMNKNRHLKNGDVRESDNWQKFFGNGKEHYNVCIKSGTRHFMDWWLLHRGYSAREEIDDALCGLMFNVMAYYHKILVDRIENE